ncbi:mucin-2 [Colossoma macropomum]|uniref:mucin-2 n=1 Tax=Colossoma macropomum TaxID=42526 RepID=UPI001864E5F1|nr:mucin-2 [Colossoma macropomum]
MAVNIGSVAQAGLLSQQYPPPLLPKPGKENVRLQKILKKTAKKKAASQASQTPVPFRSSLSPVNEASPDLEHSDHSTPPKTPETPIYGGTLHPRFNIRPLYQHSASPYPHHQGFAYGKPARFSPQPYVTPGLTTPQHVAPLFSYTTPPHPVPSYAATSVTVTSVTAITTMTEIVRPVDSKLGAAVSAAVQHTNNVVLVTNSSLTPTFITSTAASPQPTALDGIKPSKPMFDVPQITNYTSKTAGLKTSYYASSPTLDRSKTPVKILSEVKRGPTPTFEVRRIVTPTSELKRDRTPTREIRRGTTPTFEIKRGPTPTSEVKRGATPTSEIKRGPTPTSEIKRGPTPTFEIKRGPTPTFEIKRGTTPTSEIKRGTTPTSEIKRGTTPTSEIKRGTTPTSEIKRGTTPTSEIKRGTTPTLEIKRGTTPTSEIKSDASLLTDAKRGRTLTRARTPTLDFSPSKTPTGRPKTPSYHVSPSRTPIIEISRANPLLFAVSPVHMEGRRSKTPTSSLLGPSDEIPKEKEKPKENGLSEAIQNGEVQVKPSEISVDKMSSEIVREHELSKPQILIQDAPKFTETSGSQSPKAPVHESPKPVAPTAGYQSPKTSVHEFSKPVISSPGHQRPRVPPFAGQRPRTPTSKSKSTYYGLTPAEYVAHGGIQSYTPAFGISRSLSPSTVVSKAPEQEPQERIQNAQSKATEQSTLKEAARPKTTPKETEASKTPVGKVPPSTDAALDNRTPVAPSSEVSEPTPPVQTKLKPVQDTSKIPTSETKETKEKVSGVPVVTIPTIVVSKVDTPPSESPKAVTTVPVTQRVRTPTYSPPKPKRPPPDSVVETTKPETKPTTPSAKATTPDQNADVAKISKTNSSRSCSYYNNKQSVKEAINTAEVFVRED